MKKQDILRNDVMEEVCHLFQPMYRSCQKQKQKANGKPKSIFK